MYIGIDTRPLVIGASGGIAQLIKGVCEQVFVLYPAHRFVVFCTPFNRSILNNCFDNVGFQTLPLARYYEALDEFSVANRLDVLFRVYPTEDTLLYPLSKQIVLIPDNQHDIYPEFFEASVLKSRQTEFSRFLQRAGAIATISEFARQELLKLEDTRCNDIFLMPPALQNEHRHDNILASLSDTEKALIPKTPFLLFPANLWKHKNHRRLLDAFAKLRGRRPDLDVELVLTGYPAGWEDLVKDFPKMPIRHLGFVRPALLRVLLERARALVFFSLYEGFGIPLLEAFDAGTPVLCSNTASLPEVGKDAVLSCSPLDIGAMSALMERIFDDEDVAGMLVARGKERLRAYSWEQSAHALFAACERVCRVSGGTLPQSDFGTTESPLVSVITPSFNQGRFLRRTIESVLSQDYSQIELIVMDGGSTDNSVDILKSYGDQFYWISECDGGQTIAINNGLKRASGQILCYLNSDDVLLPGAITRVVSFFKQNPTCGLVYGNADYIDENDNFIARYNTAPYSLSRLLQDCMICQPAAFWQRSVQASIGLFDERLNFAMDYDYWLRIAARGIDIQFLPVKLACSRLYPETKTLSFRRKIYAEIFEITRKHHNYTHPSFYRGLWHHLFYESNCRKIKFLKFIVDYRVLGWLHHKWDHRSQCDKLRLKRFVRTKLVRVLDRLGLKTRLVILRNWLRDLGRVRSENVSGFWPDNWVGEILYIPAKKRSPDCSLYFAGKSPESVNLSVWIDGRKIAGYDLLPHKRDKIEIKPEDIDNKSVTIKFSKSFVDSTGRSISFLLEDTNLFAEQDL